MLGIWLILLVKVSRGCIFFKLFDFEFELLVGGFEGGFSPLAFVELDEEKFFLFLQDVVFGVIELINVHF